MIPREQWQWFGHAAHFCGARECLFHLATRIGDVIVSTVGDYRPRLANRPDETEEIGHARTYETMVFQFTEVCRDPQCGCGLPTIIPLELDMNGYTTAGAAAAGHLAMCEEWAAKDGAA